ncbi:MAG: hypothetical protein H8E14_08490 [Candidatus Marinimicrobia bacterium]|nr:hypothetical protein [Candidatus Neomarinimicrobiota bacterium]
MMPEKECFVIAPIGDPESDTRKRSDQILKHVMSPALKECGYKATRADQISEPGMITSQVIQHIVDDPLVLADLTARNPNVFYELAIRHAIRKPLVQLIKKGEQIPFDVAGTRTIHVDHHDLDSVEAAKKEIIAQVKALEKDPSIVETPISVSLDLQLLKQSDNPEQRSLADVLSVISELRISINNIDKRLENPEKLFPQDFLRDVSDKSSILSQRSKLMTYEMKKLIEEMMRVLTPIMPATKKARQEMTERLEHLQKRLDLLMMRERVF